MTARPGESVEQITVPLGDRDALEAGGKQLSVVSLHFEDYACQLGLSPTLMSNWAGTGSSTFAALTGEQSDTVRSASLSVLSAGLSVQSSADVLRDAQEKAQRAIERAKRAREEINAAREAIRQAIQDQGDAKDRMAAATLARQAAEMRLLSSAVDALLGDGAATAAIDAANVAYANAERDLHDAERREKHARDRLEDAEADMRAARKEGHEEAQDAEDVGMLLQSTLRMVPPGVLGGLPGVPAEAQLAARVPPQPRCGQPEDPIDRTQRPSELQRLCRGADSTFGATISARDPAPGFRGSMRRSARPSLSGIRTAFASRGPAIPC
jgi:exonuclease VII small subunit